MFYALQWWDNSRGCWRIICNPFTKQEFYSLSVLRKENARIRRYYPQMKTRIAIATRMDDPAAVVAEFG